MSILIRGIVCIQLAGTEAVSNPPVVTDMASYHRLALEIRGGKFPRYFDYQPFYYSVFLPAVFAFSPTGAIWLVLLAQSLLGGAAVYLTGLCAAKMWGRAAGLGAAILLCVCRFHVFYTPFMLLEVLQSFWMICILYLLLKAMEVNRLRDWLWLGAVCSCSTLTRGNALLFVPGFLALCIWLNRRNWKAWSSRIAMFLAIFYLLQLPFSLRNYQYFGHWTGPSMAQDKVLALGNNPEAPPGGLEYPPTYYRWVEQAEAEGKDHVGILQNIFKWIAREPWAWPELKFRSVLLFWDANEISNNVDFGYHGQTSGLLQQPWLLGFGVIGTLGLAGCLLLLWHLCNLRNLALLYMIATYWAATSGFYMLARFRIGALPLICVAAGFCIAEFFRRDCRPTRRKLLRPMLAVVISAFLVNCAYASYQEYVEVPLMTNLRPNGLRVDLPNSTTIYDHGPLVFGGCKVFQIGETFSLEKSFGKLPDDLLHRKAEFRLWCACDDDLKNRIAVMCNGKMLGQPEREGAFLVWKMPDNVLSETLSFKIVVPATMENPANINIDFLRRYGRTIFNGETINGEVVAEVRTEI